MSALSAAEQAERRMEQQTADNKTIFGFWVYIMTDCVLFASLFATYAALHQNTYGGPSGHDIFNLPFALTETLILLTSSFTCGLAMLALHRRDKKQVMFWFGVTFLLGIAFLTMEVTEFTHLVHDGNSWRRSGFLSSFFTLVATHGLHITVGLIWMFVMGVRMLKTGLSRAVVRRLTLLSLFWHFLDIVWIFIFTVVYMMGGAGL